MDPSRPNSPARRSRPNSPVRPQRSRRSATANNTAGMLALSSELNQMLDMAAPLPVNKPFVAEAHADSEPTKDDVAAIDDIAATDHEAVPNDVDWGSEDVALENNNVEDDLEVAADTETMEETDFMNLSDGMHLTGECIHVAHPTHFRNATLTLPAHVQTAART